MSSDLEIKRLVTNTANYTTRGAMKWSMGMKRTYTHYL